MQMLLLIAAVAFAPVDGTRVAEIEKMLAERPVLPGPSPADRTVWDVFAADPRSASIIAEANEAERNPTPDLPDELYLEFSRNGNRSRYEKPFFSRLDRLQALTLAECFEWKGRFLPSVRRELQAILDEKRWNLPAHDRSLRAFKGEQVNVDLFASERAWGVALTARLLAGRLGEDMEKRAIARVRERAVDPYLAIACGKAKPDEHAAWWVFDANNWNRVCHAGCCSAALLVCDSRHERAQAITLAEAMLPNYLAGFGDDGYCEEGIGYWNYGFGNHLLLGLYVRMATGGQVDLFADAKNLEVAMYPVRVALDETLQTPLFADANGKPAKLMMSFCAAIWPHADIPAGFCSSKVPFDCGGGSSWPATAMFMMQAFGPKPPQRNGNGAKLADRDWFGDSGVLVSRIGGSSFAAAVKTCNRGFSHCHADAGSYVLVEDGKMLAGDCGGEQYTSRTFSSHRFDSKVLNSYGHPLPVVEGKLQRTDRADTRVIFRALTPERDTLSVDLKPAYPKAKHLVALTRTYVFDRMEKTFAVTDTVRFAAPASFETAIVTVDPNRLEGRYDVTVFGGGWTTVVEDIENPNRLAPRRIGIRMTEPVKEASITVTYRAKK